MLFHDRAHAGAELLAPARRHAPTAAGPISQETGNQDGDCRIFRGELERAAGGARDYVGGER